MRFVVLKLLDGSKCVAAKLNNMIFFVCTLVSKLKLWTNIHADKCTVQTKW